MIKTRASMYAAQLGVSSDEFKASNGWLHKFSKRFGLRSRFLHGEAGGVDIGEAEETMKQFRSCLRGYRLEDIYNADEAGLFYKCMPRRSYVLRDEDLRQVKGSKSTTDKQRITLFLCVNATGSHKLPVLVIGKSANPRCFRTARPPPGVHYRSNKTAWNNADETLHWLEHIFIPHVRSRSQHKVALVWDNASMHMCDPRLKNIAQRWGVHLHCLPPNVTSIHQPLDQGIISWVKAAYRREMVLRYIVAMDNWDAVRTRGKSLPAGARGIDFGHEPTVLDAANLIDIAWKELSPPVVACCFHGSRCLPEKLQRELAGLISIMSSGRTLSSHGSHDQCRSVSFHTPKSHSDASSSSSSASLSAGSTQQQSRFMAAERITVELVEGVNIGGVSVAGMRAQMHARGQRGTGDRNENVEETPIAADEQGAKESAPGSTSSPTQDHHDDPNHCEQQQIKRMDDFSNNNNNNNNNDGSQQPRCDQRQDQVDGVQAQSSSLTGSEGSTHGETQQVPCYRAKVESKYSATITWFEAVVQRSGFSTMPRAELRRAGDCAPATLLSFMRRLFDPREEQPFSATLTTHKWTLEHVRMRMAQCAATRDDLLRAELEVEDDVPIEEIDRLSFCALAMLGEGRTISPHHFLAETWLATAIVLISEMLMASVEISEGDAKQEATHIINQTVVIRAVRSAADFKRMESSEAAVPDQTFMLIGNKNHFVLAFKSLPAPVIPALLVNRRQTEVQSEQNSESTGVDDMFEEVVADNEDHQSSNNITSEDSEQREQPTSECTNVDSLILETSLTCAACSVDAVVHDITTALTQMHSDRTTGIPVEQQSSSDSPRTSDVSRSYPEFMKGSLLVPDVEPSAASGSCGTASAIDEQAATQAMEETVREWIAVDEMPGLEEECEELQDDEETPEINESDTNPSEPSNEDTTIADIQKWADEFPMAERYFTARGLGDEARNHLYGLSSLITASETSILRQKLVRSRQPTLYECITKLSDKE